MGRPNFDPDALMDRVEELSAEVAGLKELRTIFAPLMPMFQDDTGESVAMAAQMVERLHNFMLTTLPEMEAMFAAAGQGGTIAALDENDLEALRAGKPSGVKVVMDKLKSMVQGDAKT